MSKLGAAFKNKRESLGIDIDKATEETRISADIIQVLENGEFKGMPSFNHAKNFVKNYAEYLKLDMDKVHELFDEECTKEDFNRDVKYVAAPVTKEKTSSPTSGAKFIVPIVIVAVILFSGYKIFSSMQKGEAIVQAENPAEEVKKDVDTEIDTPVDEQEVKEVIESIKNETAETAPAETAAPAEKAVEKPAAQEKKPVKAEEKTVKKDDVTATSAFLPEKKQEPATEAKTAKVNFVDVCWVHIKIDDSEEMDFIAEKGTERDVLFHDNFVMDIGNAAVVSISYNNRTIAGLGAYKQPIKGLKFTVNESDRLTYTSVK